LLLIITGLACASAKIYKYVAMEMFTVMYMVKKTTVLLREDVYQILKEKAGARKISSLINEILIEYFAKKESMFGTMRRVDMSDLRNHRERL